MVGNLLPTQKIFAGKRHCLFAFCPFVVTAALLLSSGCAMVGPDYETPEADTADAWLGEEDERVAAEHHDVPRFQQQALRRIAPLQTADAEPGIITQ